MIQRNKVLLTILVLFILLINCKQGVKKQEETIIKGDVSVYVDETLTPIVEDQVAVFQSVYEAKIKLISKSESDVISDMLHQKSVIAILTRDLNKEELKIFENKKVIPKITKFATDGIAFITNKSNNDTLLALEDVISFMNSRETKSIKGLVFDNPNSSTVRFLQTLSGVDNTREKGIYSMKTNEEVIKFIANNSGMIGIVGVNWLSQPSHAMQEFVDGVNLISIKDLNKSEYYSPSQNNIAEGKYPLVRDLYIINCQGYSGLGMGFASFVAGDIGQRIILKSGLLPIRIPGRKLNIRKEFKTDNK
jgi:phosphate transport system substrate-binding protein